MALSKVMMPRAIFVGFQQCPPSIVSSQMCSGPRLKTEEERDLGMCNDNDDLRRKGNSFIIDEMLDTRMYIAIMDKLTNLFAMNIEDNRVVSISGIPYGLIINYSAILQALQRP